MRTRNIIFYCIPLIILVWAFNPLKKQKINIVFIGDSITEAGGLKDRAVNSPSASAVAFLKKIGYEKVDFRNEGRSGFTTVDFLPKPNGVYQSVVKAAKSFTDDGQLVFSIMLGTNDSAIKGPNGAPVSKENYRSNIKTLSDSLISKFPKCMILLNYPIWYSDSTQNSSTYLTEGRERLNSYMPAIASLVIEYHSKNIKNVFLGDKMGYEYFKKNYLSDMSTEKGPSGIFYLHPNDKGSIALGKFWGNALNKMLKSKKDYGFEQMEVIK